MIDAYPGVATLDMLAKRGRGVKIELVTHSNGELEESDFEAFGAQCGKFTKTICGICHDRFIIVDQKEIFWTGAQGRGPTHLRRRKDGRGDHPWASRINPQGDVGTTGIRQRQEGGGREGAEDVKFLQNQQDLQD